MARATINDRCFKFLSNTNCYKIINNKQVPNHNLKDLYNTLNCDTKRESIFFNYCLHPDNCINIFKFKYISSKEITYQFFKFDLNLYIKYFNNFYTIMEKNADDENGPPNILYNFVTDSYKLGLSETPSNKSYNKLIKKYSEDLCYLLNLCDYVDFDYLDIEFKVLNMYTYKKALNIFKKQNDLLNQSDDYIIKFIENKMKINDICNV